MKQNNKIAVIGGTGKSGQYLVQVLLKKGFLIKLLLRNPEKLNFKNSLIEIVPGSVKDYECVRELLNGCQAVISTLGLGIPPSEPDIFSKATTHVIRAMQELGIMRYLVVTGLNVDTPFDQKNPKTKFSTEWMKTHYPTSTADRQTEYQLLTASNLNWTLVRLPLIEQTDIQGEININLEDCLGDKISATDLAYFLINQLADQTYFEQAPFIANS